MKIGVFGASGRVGRLLIEEIGRNEELDLGSIFVRKEVSFLLPQGVFVTNDLENFNNHCDMIIDFSLPSATDMLLDKLLSFPKPLVCGTTGLEEKTLDKIKKLSTLTKVFYATNMSKGVAMLNHISKLLSLSLPESDIEIIELHHRHKKDSPSGTALSLAKTCAKARGLVLDKVKVCGREGDVGERKKEEIGLFSLRGGDVAGRHTIGFYMDGEFLELTHNATSRITFAKGALEASKWLFKQKNGLYSMEDMLKL